MLRLGLPMEVPLPRSRWAQMQPLTPLPLLKELMFLFILLLLLMATVPDAVKAANSRPYLVQIDPNKVPENILPGNVIATLKTIDFDSGQSHTYELLTNHGGRVALDGDKLVATNTPLNYEVAEITYLKITSTDNGSPPLSQTFQVPLRILDRNDAPHRLILSNSIIGKNLNESDVIGSFQVADQDNLRNRNWLKDRPTQTHSIELCPSSSSLAGFLHIDENHNLVLSGSVVGVPEQFDACFTVTDTGSPPASANIPLTLIWEGSAKPPLFTELNFTHVEETTIASTQQVGDVVGQAIAYHADDTATLAFHLLSADILDVAPNTSAACTALPASQLPADIDLPDYVATIARCHVHLVLVRALDFETEGNITITVVVQDTRALLPAATTFSLRVLDMNEPPEAVIIVPSVRENVEPRELISSIVIDDEDAGQAHAVQLLWARLQDTRPCAALVVTADNQALLANDTACFDYERSPTITAALRVTDSGVPPLSAEFEVTLLVEDVNERPALVWLNSSSVSEAAPEGHLVGVLAVADPDNANAAKQTATCRVLDANSPFAVSLSSASNETRVSVSAATASATAAAIASSSVPVPGGLLVVERPFLIDFESAAQHTVPLRCTDSGTPPLSLDLALLVNVTDVNEAPFGLSLSGTRVAENLPAGTPVGFLFAVDPDDGAGASRGQAQPLTFCVLATTGNSGGGVDEGAATANTTDAAVATPTAMASTAAGTTQQAPASTTEQDIDPCHTEAVGETPPFRVVGNRLETTRALNAEDEGVVRVWVRAVDSGWLWTEEAFDVTVVDRNDPPQHIVFAPAVVEENVEGAVLGTLATVDEDVGQTHVYKAEVEAATTDIQVEVVPTDNTNDSNDGDTPGSNQDSTTALPPAATLRLAAGQALDYERTPTLRVRVTATDSGGAQARSVSQVFDIEVQNRNEAPTSVQLQPLLTPGHATQRLVVPENTLVGTPIAHVAVSDPDNTPYVAEQQTHTCNVTLAPTANGTTTSSAAGTGAGAGAGALIDAILLGNITELRLARALDFETATDVTLRLQCTDSGTPPLSVTSDVAFVVSNVNEPPSIRFEASPALSNGTSGSNGGARVPTTVHVRENGAVPSLLGHVLVSDPDDCDSLRCGPPTTFTFDATPPGLVQVLSDYRVILKAPLNFEERQRVAASLTVYDGSEDSQDSPVASASVNISIAVVDVNDPITQVTCTPVSVSEQAPRGTALATCSATDEDRDTGSFGQHRFRVLWTNAPTPALAMHGIYADSSSPSRATLRLNATLDFESTPSLALQVTARDVSSTPLFGSTTTSVAVEDVDEPPHVELVPRTTPLDEGTYVQVALGRIAAAVDPEGATVTCTATAIQPMANRTSGAPGGGESTGEGVMAARKAYCERVQAAGGYNVSMTGSMTIVLSGPIDFECTHIINASITCTDGTTFTHLALQVPVQDVLEAPQALVLAVSETLQSRVVGVFPPVGGDGSGRLRVVASSGTAARIEITEENAAANPLLLGRLACVGGTPHGCSAVLTSATVAVPLEASAGQLGPGEVPPTRPAREVAIAVGGVSDDDDDGDGDASNSAGDTVSLSLNAPTGDLFLHGAAFDYEQGAVWTLQLVAASASTDDSAAVGTAAFQVDIVVRDVMEPPRSLASLCGCRDNPCYNGGKCVAAEDSLGSMAALEYTCLCPPSARGAVCMTAEETSPDADAADASNAGRDGNPFYCLRFDENVAAGAVLARLVVSDDDIGDSFDVEVGGPLGFAVTVTSDLDVVVSAPLAPVLAVHAGPHIPVWFVATDAAGLRLNVSTEAEVTPCAGVLGVCGVDDTCVVEADSGDAVCKCGPGFVFSASAGQCVERICLHAREGEVCTALTDTCASQQCANGATCVDGTDEQGRDTFQCLCPPGYGGFRCEAKQTQCSQQPCLNGGTCSDAVTETSGVGFACACSSAYTGTRCQYAVNACTDNRCGGLTTCVPRPTDVLSSGSGAGGGVATQPYTCVSQRSLVELQLSSSTCSGNGDDAGADPDCGDGQSGAVEAVLSAGAPANVSVFVVRAAVVDDLYVVTLAVVDVTTGATLDAGQVTTLLHSYCGNQTSAGTTTTTTTSPATAAGNSTLPPRPASNPLCAPGSVVIVEAGASVRGSTSSPVVASTSATSTAPNTVTPQSTTRSGATAGASSGDVSTGVVVGYVFAGLLLVALVVLASAILRRRGKEESVVINLANKEGAAADTGPQTLEATNPAFLRSSTSWLQDQAHHVPRDEGSEDDGGASTATKPSHYHHNQGQQHGPGATQSAGEQAADVDETAFDAFFSHPGLVYPDRRSSRAKVDRARLDAQDGSEISGETHGEDANTWQHRGDHAGDDSLWGVSRRRRGSRISHRQQQRSLEVPTPELDSDDEDVGYIEVESVGLDGTRSLRRVRRPSDCDLDGADLQEPVFLNPLLTSSGIVASDNNSDAAEVGTHEQGSAGGDEANNTRMQADD